MFIQNGKLIKTYFDMTGYGQSIQEISYDANDMIMFDLPEISDWVVS